MVRQKPILYHSGGIMIRAEESVIGILAHVDAGKTTLTESILYKTGAIRHFGRVDKKDSWFDSHELERSRGITIFSKQNPFSLGEKRFTLVDTPGHTDFSAEMERTLGVLDYAVLVIDGTGGVRSHTETIWRLLGEYKVPPFIFINKMDRAEKGREKLLGELKNCFGDGFVDFSCGDEKRILEEVSMLSEDLLGEYLDGNTDEEFWLRSIADEIAQRRLFPCFFGSALSGDGVDGLLEAIEKLTVAKEYPDEFGARVYKVLYDSKGCRQTFLKVTGGVLSVKMPLGIEKADRIRIYSGEKAENAEKIKAGGVCAVEGLRSAEPGDVLGADGRRFSRPAKLRPMLAAGVEILDSTDFHDALRKLRMLGEEMPELSVQCFSSGGVEQIQIQVMGRIQLEILKELVAERFGMAIDFGACRILYKETVASPVMGYGHYEPLRHYAEVHLRIEPAPRDSGVAAESECSLEVLDSNFQNVVLTHILEKEHKGILTGSPLTDVKIVLTAGRSHLKHTEGGDFREAVYRAVRQGLEKAENVLLEPYYAFTLRVPGEYVGRAISDIQRLCGEFDPPDIAEEYATIKGCAPVSEFMDYPREVTAYTGGRGSVSLSENGYRPCHNAAEVIEKIGYEKERDLENPSSSIFCSHGAGFEVKWQDVDRMRHIKD